MQASLCPCGSNKDFSVCCGPYLSGAALPATAEHLMRSRYSAFATQNIDYLKQTLWPKHHPRFDAVATASWASENHWVGLTILAREKGEASDRQGHVLFEARYLSGGQLKVHRERSLFRKKAGRWFYLEAVAE